MEKTKCWYIDICRAGQVEDAIAEAAEVTWKPGFWNMILKEKDENHSLQKQIEQ